MNSDDRGRPWTRHPPDGSFIGAVPVGDAPSIERLPGRRELVYDPISDQFIELDSDAADEDEPQGQPA